MSTSDDQVRLEILELLHKRLGDDPKRSGVDRAIIQDSLKLSEKQMDINMSYLVDKALVTLTWTLGSQWTFAKITADGTDVIENKERYTFKYPFVRALSSQILDESDKTVFQTVVPEGNFGQTMADAFRQSRDQIYAANLSRADKEKIEKNLRALEKELSKNKKADLGTIQKDWEELKKKASWLTPPISQFVLEVIKNVLDLK